MQKKLKDILSDPPHGLSTVANILLLVSFVLLMSIFFLDLVEENDVMLNLLPDKPTVEIVAPQNQLAEMDYEHLYAVAAKGQTIEIGDTLFGSMQAADVAMINTWLGLIEKGDFLPNNQMLDLDFVDEATRKKMVELAKVKTPPKKINEKRRQELIKLIPELNKKVDELRVAILKFEELNDKYRADFYRAREKYNDRLLSNAELTRYKRKWDENDDIVNQRKQELLAEIKFLKEEQSELDYLNTKKRTIARLNKDTDYTFYEADLARSLDSLQQSGVILAEYDGELEMIADLDSVSSGDIIATYAGEELQNSRSKRLVAEVINPKDAKKVYKGRALTIVLKNNSTIQGMIDSIKIAKGKYEIVSNEELSDMDIDRIILPAKKQNFIEKVLDNF